MAGIKGEPKIVKERKKKPGLLDILFESKTLDEIKGAILNQPILQYRCEFIP